MNIFTSDECEVITAFLCLSAWDIPDEIPIANTVAKLALSKIQSRLPKSGAIDSEGVLSLTRNNFQSRSRQIEFCPMFLFMINWADSGPGLSWPETYYATYFPNIDRYVVTASLDCPDMWGVTDLAVGSFSPKLGLIEGAKTIICAWWGTQRSNGQERFAYVWNEGLVNSKQASGWADQVWRNDFNEEDE